MSAFGENLRRERDLRGVSLTEISQATKIGARLLDAIETERFERLPGGVFNSAFVRQYARYLGLDEDKIVAEFLTAFGSTKEQENQQRDAAIGALKQMVTEPPSDSAPRLPLIIAAGLLLAGALAVGGWRIWQGSSGDTLKPPPRATTHAAPSPPPAPVVEPTPTPAAETPAVTEKTEKANAPSGLTLELQATDRCTIHVSIDGRPEWFAVMLRAGRRTLKAERTLQLTVDNAAALLVTRNGETMPPLGEHGETKTITYRAR
jgi:cytoskeletal protein RodZ